MVKIISYKTNTHFFFKISKILIINAIVVISVLMLCRDRQTPLIALRSNHCTDDLSAQKIEEKSEEEPSFSQPVVLSAIANLESSSYLIEWSV